MGLLKRTWKAAARSVLLLLIPAACLTAGREKVSAETKAGGTSGDQITWVLDNEGVLTLSGTVAIPAAAKAGGRTGAPWGEYAENIVSVRVGSGITGVGLSNFYGCTALESVELAGTVTEIGAAAFSGCTALREFSASGELTLIGNEAFRGCSSLTGLSLTFSEAGGTIGTAAFYGCSSLRKPVLSGPVLSLGDSAFRGCSSLTGLSLTFSEAGGTLSASAFYGCSSLRECSVTGNLQTIGDYAFYSCPSLTEFFIPSGVSSVGSYAFCSCKALKTLILPDSVSLIGSSPFSGSGLSVIYYLGNECAWSALTDFSGKTAAEALLQFPSSSGSAGEAGNISWYLYSDGLLLLAGDGAMEDAQDGALLWNGSGSAVREVLLESGITRVGDCAFTGCTNLTRVSLPETVTAIGSRAFASCSALENMTLPSRLTEIGSGAFSGCSSLTELCLPNGLKSIGDSPFPGCTSLTLLRYYGSEEDWALIPDFEGRDALESLLVKASCYGSSGQNGTVTWYLFDDGLLHLSGSGAPGVPWSTHRGDLTSVIAEDGITELSAGSFSGCGKLKSAELPESLCSIGEDAFLDCVSLTGISLPANVSSIGAGAFSGCSSLRELVLPSGLTRIESRTFFNCSSLKEMILPGSVTEIGSMAYSGCTALTGIIIPESVSLIGDFAFRYCFSLEKIYYTGELSGWDAVSCDQGFSGMGASAEALLRCPSYSGSAGSDIIWSLFDDGLLLLTGSGAMTDFVSGGAPWYAYRSAILSVRLEKRISSIGSYAFADCTALCSLEAADTVSFDTAAFLNCESLREIPEIGGAISSNAFFSCTALQDIVIREGVSSLSSQAFYGCSGLESVVIPSSVQTIGEYCFGGCVKLSAVYYSGTAAEWEAIETGIRNEPLFSAAIYYGVTEKVYQLERLIESIGTVSYEISCFDKIEAARTAYDALSEAEKTLVSSRSALVSAESEFRALEALQAQYAVCLTSRVSGGTDSAALLSGGGMFYSVRGADILAPRLEDFDFIGWYVSEDGEETLLSSSRSLRVHPDEAAGGLKLTAVYAPKTGAFCTVTVSGEAYTISGADTVQTGTDTRSFAAGTEVTVTFADGSRKFFAWTDASGQLSGKEESFSFTVLKDTELTAFSVPSGSANPYSMVLFEDGSGHLISAKLYALTDTIVFPAAPAAAGKTFLKWDKSVYEIRKAMETDEYVTVTAVYGQTANK